MIEIATQSSDLVVHFGDRFLIGPASPGWALHSGRLDDYHLYGRRIEAL